MIEVDYASHGPQIDTIADQLTRDLAGLAPVEAPVAFYSTVTAQRIDTTTLDTDYWVETCATGYGSPTPSPPSSLTATGCSSKPAPTRC